MYYCSIILKKRKNFECQLKKHNISSMDFIKYIEYEEALLNYIYTQKCDLGLDTSSRLNCETEIIERIRRLFQTCIQTFPNEISICMWYYIFSKKCNSRQLAENSIQHLIHVYIIQLSHLFSYNFYNFSYIQIIL